MTGNNNTSNKNTGENWLWNAAQSLATILASFSTSGANWAANSSLPKMLAGISGILTNNDDTPAWKHWLQGWVVKKGEFAGRFNDDSITPTYSYTDTVLARVGPGKSFDDVRAEDAHIKIELPPEKELPAAESEKHADASIGGGFPNIRNFNDVRGELYNPPAQQSENSGPTPVRTPDAPSWAPGSGKAA